MQNKIYHTKKSLGQNFLKSDGALRKIIEVGEISTKDIILEIGPGKGALTKKLLEKAGYVFAIEKDKNLVKFLQEKFFEEIKNKKLFLVEGDILKFNITDGFASSNFSSLRPSPSTEWDPREQKIERSSAIGVPSKTFYPSLSYKIVANIPYNITGAILKKFLTEKNQPTMMVLMVQNEVAHRIVARDGKESILSISVKAYGVPKLEMKVPARYFSPTPKVDSAIVSIKNISRDFFTKNKVNEKRFWEIIHAGFTHKRKKLASNLKKILKLDAKTQKNYEKLLGNKRAENLTLSDWLLLTKNE
jgi:16S rRNA (adenine1518-N6/adenine1519-N6)-dimethyltransferase